MIIIEIVKCTSVTCTFSTFLEQLASLHRFHFVLGLHSIFYGSFCNNGSVIFFCLYGKYFKDFQHYLGFIMCVSVCGSVEHYNVFLIVFEPLVLKSKTGRAQTAYVYHAPLLQSTFAYLFMQIHYTILVCYYGMFLTHRLTKLL